MTLDDFQPLVERKSLIRLCGNCSKRATAVMHTVNAIQCFMVELSSPCDAF